MPFFGGVPALAAGANTRGFAVSGGLVVNNNVIIKPSGEGVFLEVANASALYTTKAYAASNTYVNAREDAIFANVNPRIISVVGTAATANTKAVQALADAAAANTRAENARSVAVNANTNLNAYKANTNPRFDLYLPLTGGTLSANLKISSASNDAMLTIESTNPGTVAAPVIDLYKNSASPADGDYLGQLKFQGESDSGAKRVYAKLTGKTSDVSNGSEDGLFEIAVRSGGSNKITNRLTGSETQTLNGIVFTENGNRLASNGYVQRYLAVANSVPKTGGSFTGGIDIAGNLKLDASNSELNIKSGVGGTTGAVNWTFNTDSTNYAAIKLPYDTRASTGLHVDVGYPLTLDPTTRINFAISGTTYATFDTNGYNGQLNSYTEKARSDSVGTATYTINCNNENIITLTMTGNPTIAFSNVPSSGTAWSCTLILVHSGGARTVTWPSSVKWSGGSAPTLSTGSGDKDIITLFTVDGGTNWYGSSPGQDFS